jgi:hypothetical protein
MALPRLHLKMVSLIGGNSMIISRKDMEHLSMLMETDTLGNSCRMSNTGMEYSDGQMEMYIKDNGHRVKEKVMHITRLIMTKSIMVSTRMICGGERE